MKLTLQHIHINAVRLGLACAVLLFATPAAQTATAATPGPFKAGMNLLMNPSHEGPGVFFGGRGEIFVSWSWVPFWAEPPAGMDKRDPAFRTPEFRMSDARDPKLGGRVRSEMLSDHGFNFWASNPTAGFMQYVKNLRPGSPVRFSTHTLLWTSNVANTFPPSSELPGDLQAKVCIDQDGGPRNHLDPNLVCSEWSNKYDTWHQLTVDGVAKTSTVNVFLWVRSSMHVQHNDYYMDDSCFEVLPRAGAKGVCKDGGLVPTGKGVTEWYKAYDK